MLMVFHLFVLKEISLKEQLLDKMEKDLEMFKRKFSVILHQKVATLSEFVQSRHYNKNHDLWPDLLSLR